MIITKQVNGAVHHNITCDQVDFDGTTTALTVNGIDLQNLQLIPSGQRAEIRARCYGTGVTDYLGTETEGLTIWNISGYVDSGGTIKGTPSEAESVKWNFSSPSGTINFSLTAASLSFGIDAVASVPSGFVSGYVSAEIDVIVQDWDAAAP